MGNCQTAEVAAVVIQHPAGGDDGVGRVKVERAHGTLSAAAVMAANPGHYVAAIIPTDATVAASRSRAAKKRRLKLLRPDDTLALGGVYRLVSFEEVLREFVSKRHATLSHMVVVATAATDDDRRPESDRSLADKQQDEEDHHQWEETAISKRTLGRRAILQRRHKMEMGCLNSKQGTNLQSIAIKQEATSGPLDPTAKGHRPSDPEPNSGAALVMLGGRLGLARHGQWRPALPSIAEGSAAEESPLLSV